MRFVVLNVDYPDFLDDLYRNAPGLGHQSYGAQLDARMATMFGVADFYTHALRELGHDAIDIHANNANLQLTWAREHGLRVSFGRTRAKTLGASHAWAESRGEPGKRRVARTLRGLVHGNVDPMLLPVLYAQLEEFEPDVVLNQAPNCLLPHVVRRVGECASLQVAQTASPLPRWTDFSLFDLVVSSIPSFVKNFRRQHIRSELQPLAFDPRVLDRLPQRSDDIDFSFIGTLSSVHRARIELVELLAATTGLQVYGRVEPGAVVSDRLAREMKGGVYGVDMYRCLRASRLTLNVHGGPFPNESNNLRLYEATGVGTTLLTDEGSNLHELFEPGVEVAAFRTAEDCERLANELLHDPARLAEMGAAGQRRVLECHTYVHRMSDLVRLIGSL